MDSLEPPAEEMSSYSIYFLHEKEIDKIYIYIYFRTRIKRIKHLFQFKKWNNVTPVPVISK